VRRGRELVCGAGQVCARRAQEQNVADGAGSAGVAQARMWSACGSRRCRWSRRAATVRVGERRQHGGRLRLASGGALVGDDVRRTLMRVNGRDAEVLEQTWESATQTWVGPSYGTGRTCRVARPRAVVERAENRAGTRGTEEHEGPAIGRGVKSARRRRADVATVCRATVFRCGATRPRRRGSSR
jgi:hypothetical protein